MLAALKATIPSSAIQSYLFMNFPQAGRLLSPGGSAFDPPFTVLSGRTIAAIIEEIRPAFAGGTDLTLKSMEAS